MNQVIKLNNEIGIDLPKLIDSRLLVQANSGGGKSWLLRRLLEQSHGSVQQIILDPEGEFSTLREKYDYVLAGKDGDTPAEPRSAALLAKKLLELNVSAIIDLYELPPQERKRFVRLFLDAMVNAPKDLWHPALVVIDEAHVFVPEKDQSEASSAVIDLATRGRKRGFCAVLATQRISKLAKDAAAECNNKLIGRSSQDIDMKRAGEELGFTSREQFFSLRQLTPGEFFAFGPAISDEVQRLKVGPVYTSHPKAGSRSLTTVTPPTEGIRKILGKLADLPAEAEKEARTTAELRQEVARLNRELSAAKRAPNSGPAVRIERIEVPAVGKRALEGIKESETKMRKAVQAIKEYTAAVETSVAKLSGELAKVSSSAPKPQIALKQPAAIRTDRELIARGTVVLKKEMGIDTLTGPEHRILDAIAWMESIGISEPQQTAVAFLAGYTIGGGGFNNPRGSLRTKGLVEYRGNCIAFTDQGRQLAKMPETPLTVKEMHDHILAILPGPETKLLKVLLEAYPEAITNEELAERTEYTNGGGGFNNPRGRLRTLGLIDYVPGGKVVAKPFLFLQ